MTFWYRRRPGHHREHPTLRRFFFRMGWAALALHATAGSARAQDNERVMDCVGSEQRVGTCELVFDWWAELAVWGAVTASVITTQIQRGSETGEPRWNSAFGWEKNIRRRILPRTAGGQARAGEISDELLLRAVPFAVVATEAMLALANPQSLPWSSEIAEDLYIVATSAVLAGQVNELLKINTARSRPSVYPVQGRAYGPAAVHSFASGHAAVTFATGVSFASVLYLRGYRWWWLAALVAGAAGSSVAVLRIASDDHWAGDVVAGSLLGIGTGVLYPLLAHPRRSYGNLAADSESSGWLASTAGTLSVSPRGLGLTWRW